MDRLEQWETAIESRIIALHLALFVEFFVAEGANNDGDLEGEA